MKNYKRKEIEKQKLWVNVSHTQQGIQWAMARRNHMFANYSDKGTKFYDNTSQKKSLHNKTR